MNNDTLIGNLSDQIGRFISNSAAREDMQKSINVLVQSAFTKLDLVTREQFDAQLEALEHASSRLSTLEQELATMQERLDALEGCADD